MALLEITRMRADIANSRAEWEARSMALRESWSGRRGLSMLTSVSPNPWGNAEWFEAPLSVHLFTAAPRW